MVMNELRRVEESRSEALHPYSTGVARKPVDRMSRDGRSLNEGEGERDASQPP